MPALLPNAVWVPGPASGGGTYNPGPSTRWKIVVHEIQGDDRLSMIASHPTPPHTWYDPVSRDHHQSIPLNRAALALYHYRGRPETNKALALQVELAGFSEATAVEPVTSLTNIAVDVVVPYCQFVAEQGASIDLRQVSGPFVYSMAATESSVNRMSDAAFQAFNGLTGHAFVPQNDHWDPGGMDLVRIAGHAAMIIGGMLSVVAFNLEDDMAILVNDGGTIWATNGVTKIMKRDPAFLLAEINAGIYGDPNRWTHQGQLAIPASPHAYQILRDAMTVDEWGIQGMPDRVGSVLQAQLPVLAPMVANELRKPGMFPNPTAEVDADAIAAAVAGKLDVRSLATVIVEQLVERAAQ